MMVLFMMFVTLLFWHALADYPLQGWLASAKRPNQTDYPWQIALFWHAYIHAAGVLAITGNLWGGGIELVAHGTIDFLKTRGYFGNWVDQLLHVATKVVIIAVLRVRFV